MPDFLFNALLKTGKEAKKTFIDNGDGTASLLTSSTESPLAAEYTDHSGSIAQANVSQSALPQNLNRKYLLIQNTSNASIAVNPNGAAGFTNGSIVIVPNGSYEPGVIPTNAFTVIGGTIGQTFTIKEV